MQLIRYLKKTILKPSHAQHFADATNSIFAVIRQSIGIDFTNYKQNTIRRRIERRMALHQIETPEDYITFLKENPPEVDLLHKDLLIKVTSFFRDPEAFKILQKEVIPQIIHRKPAGSAIRVWTPACATGEEAYSIAMLFQEAMEHYKKHLELHIFATDIDIESINFARQASYPDNIAAQIPPESLSRFFVREQGRYKVKKMLRDDVVFAVQNVIKDPPFSKLDLISCRNMLIYMDSTLQKRLLPLFHYVLNPDGFLFLGSSESVGHFAGLFSPVNLKWKIFSRKGVAAEHRVNLEQPFITGVAADTSKAREEAPITEIIIRKLAETIILENYAPTCVLVNSKFDILYVNGHTEPFLSLPSGQPTYNLLKMAREEIRSKLINALHKAFNDKTQVFTGTIPVQTDGQVNCYNITVRPVAAQANIGELAIVIFEQEKPAEKPRLRKKEKTDKISVRHNARMEQLEQELASTKEYLQTTVEELETSNEELKSTNEELQSANEELQSTNEEMQSTNEELDTSREELQSGNQELATINTEMRNKVLQLSQSTSDFTNLLNTTDIAALFVDNNLLIKRFTPKIKEIFKLIPADVGRSIEDIVLQLNYPDLFSDIRKVRDNLNMIEKEIRMTDGRCFRVRIRPYQTAENLIDGSVITFIDITEARQAEQLMPTQKFLLKALSLLFVNRLLFLMTSFA